MKILKTKNIISRSKDLLELLRYIHAPKSLEIADKNNNIHIVRRYTESWEYYSSNDSPDDSRTHTEEHILCESPALDMRFDTKTDISYGSYEITASYDIDLLAEVLKSAVSHLKSLDVMQKYLKLIGK